MTIDGNNNIYVADRGNQRIRKITPNADVTTIAGSGINGFQNNVNSLNAAFSNPTGILCSASDDLYIADVLNHCIRVINANGVSTFAGQGTISGSTDGTGAAAAFNNPHFIAKDNLGNMYVSDFSNNKIRKITASGVVTTLAGQGTAGSNDGTATQATFNEPAGLVIGTNGNLFVCDYSGNTIRKVDANGNVSTFAGKAGVAGYADGNGKNALFDHPVGIAIDNYGNLFVADANNNRIRVISASGDVATIAGNGNSAEADGLGTSASLYFPYGITFDKNGVLFVSDFYAHTIRKILLQ